MKPVRVVFPGSDNSLPLRMVAAGIGAKVGITLFVIGEGRYHPQNFPGAVWDERALVWDTAQNRSNYTELSLAAMAQKDGRAWLTEFANPTSLQSLDNLYSSQGRGFGQPSGYTKLCESELGIVDFADAGADADAAGDADAAVDGGPPPQQCDDITVASRYLHPNDTWLTRLRGNLPAAALATDLKLEAAAQTAVSNVHNASVAPGDAATKGSSCATASGQDAGTGLEIGGSLLVLVSFLKRRKRAS
jgi:hypothetical protein